MKRILLSFALTVLVLTATVGNAVAAPKATAFAVSGQVEAISFHMDEFSQRRELVRPLPSSFSELLLSPTTPRGTFDRTASYADPVGDNEDLAPDISSISVVQSGTSLRFRIGVANLGPDLVEGDFLVIMIDADRNAGTGCDGAEFALAALGHTYSDTVARLGRCVGRNWNLEAAQGSFSQSALAGSGTNGPGSVSFTLGTADIGTANFNFTVGSTYEGTYGDYYDTAGPFSFSAPAAVAPPPTPPAPKPAASTPAPVIVRHLAVRAEATGPTGAKVSYRAAKVTGATSVSYSKKSGTTFRLGKTIVTITARRGTRSTRSTFVVFVVDTTMPKFNSLSGITTSATLAASATVSYGPVAATDRVDQTVTVVCSPTPGGVFAAGATSVFCTARDDSGNTASAALRIVVPVFLDPMSVQTNTTMLYDASAHLTSVTTGIAISAANNPEGAPLTYTWTVTSGSISFDGLNATWIRGLQGGQPAPGTVTVTVSGASTGPYTSAIVFN